MSSANLRKDGACASKVYIMCSSVLSFIVKADTLHICEIAWEETIGDSKVAFGNRNRLRP